MSGFVYVIENGDLVKVGVSAYPKKRISRLEYSGGFKCSNVYISKNLISYAEIEASVHFILADKRFLGEWFKVGFSYAVNLVVSEIARIEQAAEDQIIKEQDVNVINDEILSEFDLAKLLSGQIVKHNPAQAVGYMFNRFYGKVEDEQIMDYCNSIAKMQNDKFDSIDDLRCFVLALSDGSKRLSTSNH